jgi:hypothetical protein
MSDVDIKHLLQEVRRNPWKLRHLRGPINMILGQSVETDLSDIFDRFAIETDSAPSGIYDKTPIAAIASTVQLTNREVHSRQMPTYLTDEKPSAVKASEEKHQVSLALQGYASISGKYTLSFMRNVPIILSGSQMVPELSSMNYDAIYAFGGKRNIAKTQNFAEVLLIIHDEFGGDNYCHWMLDWMPRLLMLLDSMEPPKAAKIAVPFKLRDYHRESLARIGFDASQVISLNAGADFASASIQFNKFYAVSSTSKTFQHAMQNGSANAVEALRNRFLPMPDNNRHPRNFILQRKQTRRVLLDEDSVKLLQKAGFATVYAEDLSFSDQVALFSNAKNILSAHGAGLANLAFCSKGTNVLEVFPSGYSTAAYYVTASAIGATYSCACVPLRKIEGATHIRDNDLECNSTIVGSWLASTPSC